MFEFLKKLKPKSTAADIAATRATIDLAALDAVLVAAEDERRERLLAGADDAEVLAIEARITTARLAVERAEVVAADLDQRHAEAVVSERTRAEQAAFDAKADKIRDAMDAWNANYATHARALAALCAQMGEADFAWHDLQHRLYIKPAEHDTSRLPKDFDRTWRGVALPPTADFNGCSEQQRDLSKVHISAALRT
ncbi:hypothetical protein ASG43_07865 [Aureimonas sp. Leaf454]|uniref:hypothetical protein n=1 Tax=Aureimonas sp. Leaf454 TaxID=1736381 RepID=UPI0006F570D1|nr:hypothetical protein [Aureimonas sp. Leaf454]KQT48762.1 hypothetical protein ASG43_07865 [Aureimonas sp. Leaf454]